MKIDFRKEGLFIMIPPGLLTRTLIVRAQLGWQPGRLDPLVLMPRPCPLFS